MASGRRSAGVTRVLSQAEFLRHTRNPAAVIESGNLRASAWFRRYKVVMPPLVFLAEEQLVAIVAHLESATEKSKLTPFAVDLTPPTCSEVRPIPAVEKSSRVIELEDWVQISLAANRRPDKGIPRCARVHAGGGAVFTSDEIGVIYRVKDRNSAPRPSSVCTIRLTRRPGRTISLREKVGRG
jgi:hypothetical protein